MNIYFLGTGSECNYQFPRRRNTSLLLEMETENVLIDVGDAFPDNWNLLKKKFPHLKFPSALFFSHAHIDHISSFAAFKYYAKREGVTFGTYATKETINEILKVFHWLKLSDFNEITYLNHGEKFQISNQEFVPILLPHGNIGSTGLKFNKTAYFADFDGSISQENLTLMEGITNVIMECNDLNKKSGSHNNLPNAVEIARKLNAERLILIHLSDDFPVGQSECQEMLDAGYPSEKFKTIIPGDLEKINF